MVSLDQLLAINLVADGLVLAALVRLRSDRFSLRIPLAALVGAAWATLAVLPGLRELGGLVQELSAGLLMVWLVRGRQGWRRLLQDLLLLLLLAAALAGLTLLAQGIASSVLGRSPWPAFGVGAVLFWTAVEGAHRWQDSTAPRREIRPLEVRWQGRRGLLWALVDTGCEATDPLSGLPVVVAERAALRKLLPRRLYEALGRPALVASADVAAAAEGDDRIERSLRLLQLRTVGEAEWLFGLRAQGRVLGGKEQPIVLCLTPRRLSSEGAFAALVGPQMCRMGEGTGS
jgi:stage II sporulation protein GA (sporulation sigma-E factor processing peptidase)